LEFSPKELIKSRRESMNPLIGYKSHKTDVDHKFATEMLKDAFTWDKKELFESIIMQKEAPKLKEKTTNQKK
jgi:hypothetical protein